MLGPLRIYGHAFETVNAMVSTRTLRIIAVGLAIVAAILIGAGPGFVQSPMNRPHATATFTNGDVTTEAMYSAFTSDLTVRAADRKTRARKHFSNSFSSIGDDAAHDLCLGANDDGNVAELHSTYGFATNDDCLDAFSGVESMHKTIMAAHMILYIGIVFAVASVALYKGELDMLSRLAAALPSILLIVGFIVTSVAFHKHEFSPADHITALLVLGFAGALGDLIAIYTVKPKGSAFGM